MRETGRKICGGIITRAVLNVQDAREFVCSRMREGPGVSVGTWGSDQLCLAAQGSWACVRTRPSMFWLLAFPQPQGLPLPGRNSPMASWGGTVGWPVGTADIWAFYPRPGRRWEPHPAAAGGLQGSCWRLAVLITSWQCIWGEGDEPIPRGYPACWRAGLSGAQRMQCVSLAGTHVCACARVQVEVSVRATCVCLATCVCAEVCRFLCLLICVIVPMGTGVYSACILCMYTSVCACMCANPSTCRAVCVRSENEALGFEFVSPVCLFMWRSVLCIHVSM